MFVGWFGLVVGLAVVVAAWLRSTVAYTQATDSLISGLLLGMGVGFLTLIFLPIVYFAVGWVVGLVQGWVFNVVLRMTSGIEVGTEPAEEVYAAPAPRRSEPSFGETVDGRNPNTRR